MGFAGSGLDAPDLLGIGVVMMVAVAAGLVVMMLVRRTLTRVEGVGLMLAYVASVALLGV